MAAFSVAHPHSSLLHHLPRHKLSSIPPPSSLHCLSFPAISLGQHRRRLISSFRFAAQTSDNEWGKDISTPPSMASSVLVKEEKEEKEGEDMSSMKQGLVDTLYTTERGLKASAETRAEIVELITQLEAKNPTPAPTQALPLLDGKWILAYTSSSELFPLLAAGTLPLVKVGEISQTFDSTAFTVQNSVSFTGPLATTSLSATASFEIRSPKCVQIKFEEGVIGTPQLTDSIEIPENVEVLGQKIDLQPIGGLLRSLQDTASSVAKTISGQPPLKIPIKTDKAQSWLLTTYLDRDLRISRGDGGSVFVLIKQGSPLLSP